MKCYRFTLDKTIALKSGPAGSLSYFIGTMVFGIAVFAGPFKATSKDELHEETLNYGPSAFGCIFFMVGSIIECVHNKVHEWQAGTACCIAHIAPS